MRRGLIYLFLEVLTRSLLLLFFDFRAEGAGRVPAGGAILASNHQSHLDPVMVRAALDRAVGYVARKTLFRPPAFGRVIGWLGAIPFDRESAPSGEMKSIVGLLRSGAALVFFPEGTRSSDGELKPLRPGIALLARRAGVPVVPVAVEGTFACWPRGRKFLRPGRIRVVYGEPVTYGPRAKRDEVLEDLSGRIAALIRRARELC